jgi:putative PIN family toxin of toxin-antitoxin system
LHLATQRGTLLKSTATEQQLFEVLARPRFALLVSSAAVEAFSKIIGAAELVVIIERIAACRDSTDDKFLELAVNGHADIILSGDADLRVLNPFRGIPIVAAATFVQSATR